MNHKSFLKILSIPIIITFYSCSNKSEVNLLTPRLIDRSLNISNSFIAKQNADLFEVIKTKSSSTNTSLTVSSWQSKASSVIEKSTEICNYIDQLKIELKNEAGFTMINEKEFFREDDVNAVNSLFVTKGKAGELKQKIMKYEDDILALDKGIDSSFKNGINYTIMLSDPVKEYQKSFIETFFSNNPVVVAMGVLSKFKNNVYIFENMVLSFCYENSK
jgi:GldM N-terminal domain